MFSKLVGFDTPDLLCLREYLLVWASMCACVCVHVKARLEFGCLLPFLPYCS